MSSANTFPHTSAYVSICTCAAQWRPKICSQSRVFGKLIEGLKVLLKLLMSQGFHGLGSVESSRTLILAIHRCLLVRGLEIGIIDVWDSSQTYW